LLLTSLLFGQIQYPVVGVEGSDFFLDAMGELLVANKAGGVIDHPPRPL